MKHIFVVNPIAGKKNQTEKIIEILDNVKKEKEGFDYILYNTTGVGDATSYVKRMCEENQNEELRFYSCGGDGTLNEVITGMVGYDNASFTCYPCGSGNDFIKASKNIDFTDLSAFFEETSERKIDIINVNGHYSINIVNVGLDAAVSYNMVKFKRLPLVSGKMAYNLALVYSVFSDMRHKAKVFIDDKLAYDGDFLLTAACNGICCGGSYYFMPSAILDDGVINQLIVKRINIFQLLKMLKKFKTGNYFDDPKIMKHIDLHDCKKIKIISNKELKYGYDGENEVSKEIDIEIIGQVLRFFYPNKVKDIDK